MLLGNDYTPAPSTKSTTTTTTKKDDSKKTEKEKAVGSTGLTFDVYGPSDEESDESDESGESGESGESDSDKEDKKGGRKGRSDEVEGEMEATFVPGLAEKTQKLIKDRQKQVRHFFFMCRFLECVKTFFVRPSPFVQLET